VGKGPYAHASTTLRMTTLSSNYLIKKEANLIFRTPMESDEQRSKKALALCDSRIGAGKGGV